MSDGLVILDGYIFGMGISFAVWCVLRDRHPAAGLTFDDCVFLAALWPISLAVFAWEKATARR